MKKIKILFILPQATQGGAETQMYTLLKYMDRSKFQIYLGFLYDNPLQIEEFRSISDIETIHFSKSHSLSPFIYFKIAEFIKKKEIDIVQTFLGNHHSYLSSFIAGRGMSVGGIRVTYDLKNTMINPINRFFLPKIFIDMKKFLLISNSHEAKKVFLSKGFDEKKILVIPNGIDYEKYSKGNKEKIISEFNLKNKFVFGMVARLEKEKNQELLIRMFHENNTDFKDSILLLVGDGTYRQELRNLIDKLDMNDQIKLAGARKDIPDLLSAMDVFLFPSVWPEGWPNSLGEAMAAGLPVISSSIGDTPYIIKNGYNGIITEVSIGSFRKEAISLMKDKKKRESLGKNASETIEKEFSRKKMILSYENFYIGLINSQTNSKK